MATYSTKIMTLDDVDYYLEVEEIPNIVDYTVTLKFYLVTSEKNKDYIKFDLKVNGEKLFDGKTSEYDYYTTKRPLPYYSYSKTYPLPEAGTLHFDVDFKLWADYSSLFYIWKSNGTASLSFDSTWVDNSSPFIHSFINISSNRYGLNASARFEAEHDTYALSSIQFTLKGLSDLQASSRMNIANGADSWAKTANTDGTYSLVLTKNANLTLYENVVFDLNASMPEDAPLDSGKNYIYEILVTALNGKSATAVGVLAVPQRVTEISCESTLDLVIGDTAELEYSVFPANAEEQSVLFESSDANVAEIDANGVITAKSEGPCVITATTVDGGFSAYCSVTVLSTAGFPKLYEVADYLTVTYFNKLLFAVDFVKGELMSIGASVDELEEISLTGKNHPVTEIMAAFVAMESNCQKLRTAATAQGIIVSNLVSTQTINKQNYNWIIVVNTWIAFLNELHSKLNGGG